MAQRQIELILMRQLASMLAMPIFVVDTEGDLLFYNEPAERLLGRRFEDVGEMRFEEWTTAFAPSWEDGTRIPSGQGPLAQALRLRRPTHGRIRITGLDGVSRTIEATAFPLEGQGGRHLGAVSIFWNVEDG